MPTIPMWAVGRHVTECTITPLTPNSVGVLSEVTADAQVMYGHLDEIEVMQEVDNENIVPMNSVYKHMVPIEFGTSYRFVELEKSAGTNKFAFLTNANYIFYKIILTRGQQSWTSYCGISSYRSQMTRRGVKATFEVVPIDMRDTAVYAPTIYG